MQNREKHIRCTYKADGRCNYISAPWIFGGVSVENWHVGGVEGQSSRWSQKNSLSTNKIYSHYLKSTLININVSHSDNRKPIEFNSHSDEKYYDARRKLIKIQDQTVSVCQKYTNAHFPRDYNMHEVRENCLTKLHIWWKHVPSTKAKLTRTTKKKSATEFFTHQRGKKHPLFLELKKVVLVGPSLLESVYNRISLKCHCFDPSF